MAKKMRKLTALVLALVLLASQLAMPSVAAESGAEPPAQTLTPSSVEVDPDTGATTTTYKSESTDPQTGATTVTTTVEKQSDVTDPDSGVNTKSTSTETETVETSKDGAHQQTTSTEASQQTTTYPDITGTTETTGATGTTGDTEGTGSEQTSDVLIEQQNVTNTTGSSQENIDTQPVGPNQEKTTYSDAGEQETISTTTTTTTTTTEDVKNNDPVNVDVGDPVPGQVKETPENTEQKTDWAEGELTDQTQWVDGETVEGQDVSAPTAGDASTGSNLTLNDTLNDEDDVVINMKPNEKWYQAEVDVTTEKLLAGEYSEIFNPDDHEGSSISTVTDENGNIVRVNVVDADGTTTTIVPEQNADGVSGWKVTTVSEQHGQRQEGEVKESATEIENAGSSKSIRNEAAEDEVKKGEQTIEEDDGTIVKTQTVCIEENGEIKYRTTEDTIKVTEEVSTAPIDPQMRQDHLDVVPQPEQKGFKPVPQDQIPQDKEEILDNNGTKVKVTLTVTEIVAGPDHELVKDGYVQEGTVIGYSATETSTSDENNYYHSETREVYGTAFSVNVTTTTDPQKLETHTITTVTERKIKDQYFTEQTRSMDVDLERTDNFQTTILTEEDDYQIIETDEGTVFLYKGMMGIVEGDVTLKNNYSIASGTIAKDENGKWYLASTTVPMEGEDLRNYPDFTNNYNGQFKWAGTYTGKNGEWVQIGRGQYAGFLTWDESATANNGAGRHTAQQYMIYNGEEVRFVYCIELNTSAPSGAYYNTKEMGDEESGDAVWFKTDGTPSAGTVEKIRMVAANGYWGTESGVGSLQAVKDLLIRYGYDDVAERLTEGTAMTGTQLSLWEYGNTSNGKKFVDTYQTNADGEYILDHNNLMIGNGDYVTWDDSTNDEPTAQTKADVAVVRNLLIALAEGTLKGGETEQITEKNSFSSGSITLKNQVTDSDTGKPVTDDDGNIKYNTAVAFTMGVSGSSINGDLIVEIMDKDGNSVRKVRLAGNDQMSLTGLVTERIHPNADGSYTIENVEIFENQPITLNLRGIQQLDDGIYIYTNKETQDFVGLATQDNEVNLKVTMEFEVIEPEVSHSSSSSTQTRTDSITSTAKAKRTDKAVFVRTTMQEQEFSQVTREQYILSTVTKIERLEEKTREKLRWETYYEQLLTTIAGEDGPGNENPNGQNQNGDGNGLTILDEEVPLAAAPRTGDSTMMWALITILALAGAAALSIAPKRKVR